MEEEWEYSRRISCVGPAESQPCRRRQQLSESAPTGRRTRQRFVSLRRGQSSYLAFLEVSQVIQRVDSSQIYQRNGSGFLEAH